ncbi:MAG: M23 family metallopeptidase [Anaerolineales bacterium]
MTSISKKRYFKWVLIPLLIIFIVTAGFILFQMIRGNSTRNTRLISWLRNPLKNQDWSMAALTRCELSTPFLFPTEGYIGYLWDDSFRPGHRHQGIDIFTKVSSGETPVYAAYNGYLSRLPDWKSSLIIRIPQDPLHPKQQIWLYYTHMADAQGNSFIKSDFPTGSADIYVEEGTLLGYQGNYSGTVDKPVGIHLHFSIVMDDGQGSFLNELKIQNTLDPSPYFDLPLNGNTNQGIIPVCQ